MRRRPKLLFLARPFPPVRATSCVRTWNIAKSLARLGWDVTVVTPHPHVWRRIDDATETAIQVEREGIRRILTEHRWRFLEPEWLACSNQRVVRVFRGVCRKFSQWLQIDPGIGWAQAAAAACASLTSNDVDLILATGSPFSSFRLAKHLSDRLGRPYVLDYRDPWTDNPHSASRPRVKTIQEEEKLLAGCGAATIVSPSWARSLERRFGVGDKLHVITNGYDSEELERIKTYAFGHFAIVYTGGFYPPKRVITPVMAALKGINRTLNGKSDWYFHYYGEEGNHVRDEAIRFGIMDRVVLHGSVPRSEALAAVRGANIAVVITSIEEKLTNEDAGIIPGKLFETLGLQTPILIIAPLGADIDRIIDTGGLARRFAGCEVDEMKSFIAEIMSGQVPQSKNPEFYAWGKIAEKLDDVLHTALTIAPEQNRSYPADLATPMVNKANKISA